MSLESLALSLPSPVFGQSLAFWLLLPLAAPQGLWLSRHKPPFPPAAGPVDGRVGRGEPLRLVAIGDSTIAGVGVPTVAEAVPGRLASSLAARLPREIRWSAFGRVGAAAAEVHKELLPQLSPKSFHAAVVSVGVNDVTKIRTTRRWRRDLGALLDGVHALSPSATIAVAGLPPLSGFPLLPQPLRFLLGLRAQTFDVVAQQEASRRSGCLYVPTFFEARPEKFAADGFHPSAETYGEWGERLAEFMAPCLR